MNKRTASTSGSSRTILSIRLIKLAHLHNVVADAVAVAVATAAAVVATRRNYNTFYIGETSFFRGCII